MHVKQASKITSSKYKITLLKQKFTEVCKNMAEFPFSGLCHDHVKYYGFCELFKFFTLDAFESFTKNWVKFFSEYVDGYKFFHTTRRISF